jgi:hypothetical protein
MLLTIRYYDVTFAVRKLAAIVQYTPDGHIEQYGERWLSADTLCDSFCR